MCGRYYIDSDITDEIEKVVHDIDRRIHQEHFLGDIRPTDVAPVIEKSDQGLKLNTSRWGYPLLKGKIWLSMREKSLFWISQLSGTEFDIIAY